MTGLPMPESTGPMLPSDTLVGSAVLVAGSGFAATTAAEALASIGGAVTSLDLADPDAIGEAIANSGAEVLVICPSTTEPCHVEDAGTEVWRTGPGRELEAAYTALAVFGSARGDAGGVVLIAVDPVALLGGPGLAASAGAQAALVSLTQSLAIEWAQRDIRINAVSVGRFAGRDDAWLARTVPALRLGERRELGWTVEYLCSPYSAYLTGTTVAIDGGDALKRYLLEPRYDSEEFLR